MSAARSSSLFKRAGCATGTPASCASSLTGDARNPRPRPAGTRSAFARAKRPKATTPTWIEQVFSLYNAPPGTRQRMPVYFYLSPDDARRLPRVRSWRYTHGDRYKPLPGYKTMVTHFHTAFTQELIDSGSLDTTPPWIPMMRATGDQHRPHLRLPRRRPPPRPRPAPAEGAGDLLRGLPPPLRRRLPDPAGRGGQRLSGRPLQHPVPQAGLLDARPRQGSAARRGPSQDTARSITPAMPPTCSR